MPKVEVKNIFICPYCNSEYIRLEEAISCINKCGEIRNPEIMRISIFSCVQCGKEFTKEVDAEFCERVHKEMLSKRSKKLNAAAIAEGQSKL